jgi:hypothetical protein
VRGIIFALLAVAGCGSSLGPTGSPTATQMSCEDYCDAYLAAACMPSNYKTVAECTMAECFHLPEAPAICQTKIKLYYDCQNMQADVCHGDMGCADQWHAVLTCQ